MWGEVSVLGSWEQVEYFAQLGEVPRLLLREDRLAIRDHVELTLPACHDLGGVAGAGQFGRETRGPFVIAASDRAEEDAHVGHGRTLARRTDPCCRRRPARDLSETGKLEFVLAQREDRCL
jgi:hypothetical protein